jgi:hypothetical protein
MSVDDLEGPSPPGDLEALKARPALERWLEGFGPCSL